MMVLTIILSGCFPLPEGACSIDTLLISETALPKGIFEETGSRSADSAPARVGIEKIGTSFSSFDQGGLVHDVYRFRGIDEANSEFEDVAHYYFVPRKSETDWLIPADLVPLPIQADKYKVACTTIKEKNVEICQYVAQYGKYVTYLNVNMIALDHTDLLFIVQDIDHRFLNCFAD